nr:ankyrin repeat domain-containing protein [Luteimonas huabeiensis]
MNRTTRHLGAVALGMAVVASAGIPTGAKEPARVTTTDISQVFPPEVAELAEAIRRGDEARVRELAPRSDLSARGDQNVTLLEWAIWHQQPGAFRALLDAGADPAQIGMDNETVAHMAAAIEDPQYLAILVERGAPVDEPAVDTGRTPIFKAVQNDRRAQIDLLVDAGADLRRTDRTGNSLLHVAGNHAGTILRLLEAGVDPRHENAQGATFQAYFYMTPERIMNPQGKAGRREVTEWLARNGIPLEAK